MDLRDLKDLTIHDVRHESRGCSCGSASDARRASYRGTSLIRNTPLVGPYSRTIPRVIWWSFLPLSSLPVPHAAPLSARLQGYLAHEGGDSYERGTPVGTSTAGTLTPPRTAVASFLLDPIQGYLAHKKTRTPQDHHRATVLL